MVQHEELRDYLLANYVVVNGSIMRKETFKQWNAGDTVGTVGLRGYKTLSISGNRYYVHRLIYLMHYGVLPDVLDHINGDKEDNDIGNLRPSSKIDNALNLHGPHKDNVSGFLGVTKKGNKYIARFRDEWLGSFNSPEEAHNEYDRIKSARIKSPPA